MRTSPDDVTTPPGFEFIRMLARGGNGYVVCARETALDRLVALKMIYGGALAAGGLARLQREGRALAALDHPHVVHVYSARPVGADLALAMEYVPGGDFETALVQGRLDVDQILRVLGDVASAIEHCWMAGIVHRDIKPANILLTDDVRGKVADFGLARLSRAAESFRTDGHVIAGTPGYIAPEQMSSPDEDNPASDSYAFAVMAHRALTGHLPNPEEGPTGLLPPALRAAFEAALHPDPDWRPRPSELMTVIEHSGPLGWAQPVRRQNDATQGESAPETLGEVENPMMSPAARTAYEHHDGKPAAAVDEARALSKLELPVYRPTRERRVARLLAPLIAVMIGVVAALTIVWLVVLR